MRTVRGVVEAGAANARGLARVPAQLQQLLQDIPAAALRRRVHEPGAHVVARAQVAAARLRHG